MIKKGVLIFVKNPYYGEVKSRLSKGLDRDLIKALYEKFVMDLLNMLKELKLSIIICFYPPNNLKLFQKWLGTNHQYLPQIGKDLGERLKNSFDQGFQLGFNHLIVIGSDSPDLPPSIIKNAIEQLNYFDTVIGPCIDGGYYLIGFSNQSYTPNVFKDISWSTSTVFENTIKRLDLEQKSYFVLEKWTDIDTIEDLKDFYNRNIESEFKNSETMIFLSKNIQKIM